MAVKTKQLTYLNDDQLSSSDNLSFSHRSNVFSITKNFRRLGSFWTNQLPPSTREQAKIMSSIALYTDAVTTADRVKRNLLNDEHNLYVNNEVYDLFSLVAFTTAVQPPDPPPPEPPPDPEDPTQPVSETGLILNVWDENNNRLNEKVRLVGTDVDGSISLELYEYSITLSSPIPVTATKVSATTSTYWAELNLANGIEITKIYTDPYKNIAINIPAVLYAGIDFIQTKGTIKIFTATWQTVDGFTYDLTQIFCNKKLYYSGKVTPYAPEGQSLYRPLLNVGNIQTGYRERYVADYVNGSKQGLDDFERLINSTLGVAINYGHVHAERLASISIDNYTKSNYVYEDLVRTIPLSNREINVLDKTNDATSKKTLQKAYNTYLIKGNYHDPGVKTYIYQDQIISPIVTLLYEKGSYKTTTINTVNRITVAKSTLKGDFTNITKNDTYSLSFSALPYLLVINIAVRELQNMYENHKENSTYYYNKYSTFNSLLKELINTIRLHAPLATLPIITITDTTHSTPIDIYLTDYLTSNT